MSSSSVLKIYSFLILLTVIFTGLLLTRKLNVIKIPVNNGPVDYSEVEDINPISSETSDGSLPPLATSPKNETPLPEKTTSLFTETTVPITTTKTEQVSPVNTTITETDNQRTTEVTNPCATPIPYTLGNIDSRFGLSKSSLLQTIQDAVSLWEDALGKKLFIYDSEGKSTSLKISLIYDSRQQLTDNNKLLAAEIENTKNAAETLKQEFEAMKITFLARKEDYTLRVETFNARQKIYNDTVISWNEKGGAPRAEYEALSLEKDYLEKETANIQLDKTNLESLLASINEKIAKYNEYIVFANQNVDINNSTANQKFTEGNYNSGTNKINIYQFSDVIKLKRVLAHELGHALGIDHTKNEKSIMYKINTATTTELTQEDIQALQDICSHN